MADWREGKYPSSNYFGQAVVPRSQSCLLSLWPLALPSLGTDGWRRFQVYVTEPVAAEVLRGLNTTNVVRPPFHLCSRCILNKCLVQDCVSTSPRVFSASTMQNTNLLRNQSSGSGRLDSRIDVDDKEVRAVEGDLAQVSGGRPTTTGLLASMINHDCLFG